MVLKADKPAASRSASYELRLSQTGSDGRQIVKTITSEELNRITPRGKPIDASREEIINVLTKSAQTVRRSPIVEAAGAIGKSLLK